MSSSKLAATALAAAAFFAAGCGSSKSATTTANTTASTSGTTTTADTSPRPTLTVIHVATGTPLPRAEWIRRANAICARLNSQLNANTVKSMQDFARYLPIAAADERNEAEQLAKLVPPATDTTRWQELVTGTEEWAAGSEQLEQSAQKGTLSVHSPQFLSTTRDHAASAHVAKVAGIKECAVV